MDLVFGLLNLGVLIGFSVLLRREVAENRRTAVAGEAPGDSRTRLLAFKVGFFVVTALVVAGLIWWSPETTSPGFVALGIVTVVILFLDQWRRGL